MTSNKAEQRLQIERARLLTHEVIEGLAETIRQHQDRELELIVAAAISTAKRLNNTPEAGAGASVAVQEHWTRRHVH